MQEDGLTNVHAENGEGRDTNAPPPPSVVGNPFEAVNTPFSEGSGEGNPSVEQLDRTFSDESVEANFAFGPLNNTFSDESGDGQLGNSPDNNNSSGNTGNQLTHVSIYIVQMIQNKQTLL